MLLLPPLPLPLLLLYAAPRIDDDADAAVAAAWSGASGSKLPPPAVGLPGGVATRCLETSRRRDSADRILRVDSTGG